MDPVEEVFVRTKGAIRPGLDRMLRAYERLGRPLDATRSILIAGTNGKGTTAAFVATLLHRVGLRVGLYSSPHLVDYCERVWLSGTHPDRSQFCNALEEIKSKLGPEEFDALSFFEIFTLIGFVLIARSGVDVAVIEVGLGGRWDATNIIDPEISVVTGIAMDHQEFLGNSLLEIAREKIGVGRSGRPLFWGRGGLIEAQPQVEAQCLEEMRQKGIVVLRRDQAFGRQGRRAWIKTASSESEPIESQSELSRDLPSFLLDNLSLAFAVTTYFCPDKLRQLSWIASGLSNHGLDWPKGQRARYDKISVQWRGHQLNLLLDVCHNPDGAAALIRSIRADASYTKMDKFPAIVSILRDKDYRGILDTISQVSQPILLFRCNSPRSWTEADIVLWNSSQKLHPNFVTALEDLLNGTDAHPELILICGSVHAVGEVLSWIENIQNLVKPGGTR